jgi:hypothetical protein
MAGTETAAGIPVLEEKMRKFEQLIDPNNPDQFQVGTIIKGRELCTRDPEGGRPRLTCTFL